VFGLVWFGFMGLMRAPPQVELTLRLYGRQKRTKDRPEVVKQLLFLLSNSPGFGGGHKTAFKIIKSKKALGSEMFKKITSDDQFGGL
jgi:hypothetical protein